MICGHAERPASCKVCTRNQALEEAAAIAHEWVDDRYSSDTAVIAQEIEEKIRALKGKP